MNEITFDMTVSNIVKFEKNTGQSLLKAFDGDVNITVIVELIKATSNADDTMIDQYVKEHGLEALINKLTDALTDSGFLAQNQKKPTDKK